MNKKHILEVTEKWVKDFVIKEQICPFAERPQELGQVYYHYADVQNETEFVEVFWETIKKMMHSESEDKNYISNSILLVPAHHTFDDILDFSSVASEFMIECNLLPHFQIVEFHPQFRFDESEENDAANFVNRSPYPFIHILRVEEVNQAIQFYDEIDEIPLRNAAKLRKIGTTKLQAFLSSLQTKE